MKRERDTSNPYLKHRSGSTRRSDFRFDSGDESSRHLKKARVVASSGSAYELPLSSTAGRGDLDGVQASQAELLQFRDEPISLSLLCGAREVASLRVPHGKERFASLPPIHRVGSAESASSRPARTVRDRAAALLAARQEAAGLEQLPEQELRGLRIIGHRARVLPWGPDGAAQEQGDGLVPLSLSSGAAAASAGSAGAAGR